MSFSLKDIVTIFLVLLALAFASLPVRAADNEMLDLDLASLMQIQITSAGRKAQNLADVPAAVYVIEQNDIANSGATSIPELLRMVPGLQVARIGSSQWAVTARGFNGTFANKLLVQIDGRSVYTPSYSGVYWDVQNVVLEDIDRIEVIRGPGATLWGANAVNGIINIITKQASDTQEGLVSVGSGNHEKLLATARYGTQLNQNIYARFYMQRHDQDSYEILNNETDAYDDWESTLGGFRLDGDQSLKDSWTVQGDFYHNERNQFISSVLTPESLTTLQPTDIYNNGDSDGFNLLARWEHKSSDNSSRTFQIYYDYTNREDFFLEQTNQTLDIDLQHRFQFTDRHDIVWGLGYRLNSDKFTDTFQVEFTPDSDDQNTFSIFIQDEITVIPNKVWLTLGSKFEHNDYSGFELQPNIRALWKPAENHRLWGSISRAARTPSRVEDNGRITAGVMPITLPIPPTYPTIPAIISIYGNSNFKTEQLIAYELGYRYSASKELSFDLALFYNNYSDLQAYSESTLSDSFDEIIINFSNTMSGEIYGLEFTTNWTPVAWFSSEISYSYIDISMKDSVDADESPVPVAEGSSPRHQLSVKTNLALRENLHFNLWGRYVDELEKSSVSSNSVIDDYITLDANIKWQPVEDLELSLVGQNLLDKKHMEFTSEQFTAPTEIGRSIFAKLTWKY